MALTFSQVASLRAQRQLGNANAALSRNFERLSTGLRINHASDDAAGLAVASGLNASSRVYGQSVKNLNDGISALNLADGATQQLSSILQRIRELATQSANGVFGNFQRNALNTEAQQLRYEFNRIVATTRFNNIGVIDSNTGRIRIQAGSTSSDGALYLNSTNLASGNAGNGTFSLASTMALTGSAGSSTTGDFNGDGIIDIAYQNLGTPSYVAIKLGNGDGTFGAARTYSVGQGSIGLTTGDFNGDSNLDIATSDITDGVVSVLMGNGDGSFRARVSYAVGTNPYYLNAADINGDGKTDLLASGVFGWVRPLINNGSGSFNLGVSFSMSTFNYGVRLGDLNGDNKLDIVMADEGQGYVDIRFGVGDGTFQPLVSYQVGAFTAAVELGDLDGDGDLDIVSADEGDGFVSVLTNHGNGFNLAVTYATANPIASLALLDVNGDGNLDIVGADGTNINILSGNGNGSFGSYQTITAFAGAYRLTVADFNGDGVKDIFTDDTITGGVLLTGTNSVSTLNEIDISSRINSLYSMRLLDSTAQRLSLGVSRIGAEQSRLNAALNHVFRLKDNYTNALHQITDIDVASESSGMLRNQILQQTANSVLNQVNLQGELVLLLLRD